jgi:polar amino acid transport system permease protein
MADNSAFLRSHGARLDRLDDGAVGKTSGQKPVRFVIDAYIEVIRNTPFLVQIFFIFFGLPSAGLRLSPNSAALLALVVNFGA